MSELCLPSPPCVMLLDPVTVFTLLVLGSFLTALATICCYVARRQQRRRQRAAVEADTRCVLSGNQGANLECNTIIIDSGNIALPSSILLLIENIIR